MPLNAGDRLGPYQIVNLIGAGGMGQVYRAQDTRLARTVAIKILSAEIDSAAAREQFDREARAISSLSGPNICTLYDVGTQDGRAYLVMEYLEGETLADRLARGPVPLKKVVEYALQIAAGLDATHRHGLIHRDLKPGNVMLTKSGVKLLDFGLAKMARPTDCLGTAADPARTITAPGVLLGTCQYVAPELLAGKEPDRRCDIFAFGAVVYEMITGRRAFDGNTQAITCARILEHDPPPMQTPEAATAQFAALDYLVRSCLVKDPEERCQNAHDIVLDLRRVNELEGQSAGSAQTGARRFQPASMVAALGLLFLAVAGILAYYRGAGSRPQTVHLSLLAPEGADFSASSVPAISPDGRRVAFAATTSGKTQLWVRDLDAPTPWAVPDTDGAFDPFWSPDSQEVGFFASSKLRKVKLNGGPVLVLCDALQGRGASWSRDGVIVFAPTTSEALYKVPAQGGKPEPVTTLDLAAGEVSHRWPSFLPDGRHFLYTSRSAEPGKAVLYAGDLASKMKQRIQNIGSNAVYSPPNFLLFVTQRTLMAETFDVRRLRASGEPFRVAADVDHIVANLQGSFSVSPSGAIAYYSGDASRINQQLAWFDRSGKKRGTVGEPGNYIKPAISPDGRTMAVDRLDPLSGAYGIWQCDLARGSPTRFTFETRQEGYPVWAPDGSSIVYAVNRGGHSQLYRKSTSGATPEEVLLDSPVDKFPSDWSRDGRYLIYYQIDPVTKYDVWALPLTGGGKPFPVLHNPFNEHRATLSPDTHWLAYTSDETGQDEVYLQSFPSPGRKWKVSVAGGGRPVWSRDGKELFYMAGDRTLMVSAVTPGATLETGTPRPLFPTHLSITRFFDVSPDGRRFLLVDPLPNPVTPPMHVVLNWTAGK